MIRILYEDKEVIAVVKPAGMPSQRDFSRTVDLLTTVETYLGQKAYLIHRLDRHVEGPIVIGKSKKAAAYLNRQIQMKEMEKTYTAVVVDSKKQLKETEERTLVHYLTKEKNKAKALQEEAYFSLSDVGKERYKKAVLKYSCMKTIKYGTINVSLLKIQLITGRFHQIRCQFSTEGMPIVGDPKYGIVDIDGKSIKEIGLQSISLCFKLPSTGEKICVDTIHKNEPFDLFQ